MTPSNYVAITYPTQWVGGRGSVLKPLSGLWRLLLIDWCTVSNWSLPRCVLTWIISHGVGRKRITCHASPSTEPEHVEGNVHLWEGVNEYTIVRILSSSLCVCVWGGVYSVHAGVSLWIRWSIMYNLHQGSCQNILCFRSTSHADYFMKSCNLRKKKKLIAFFLTKLKSDGERLWRLPLRMDNYIQKQVWHEEMDMVVVSLLLLMPSRWFNLLRNKSWLKKKPLFSTFVKSDKKVMSLCWTSGGGVVLTRPSGSPPQLTVQLKCKWSGGSEYQVILLHAVVKGRVWCSGKDEISYHSRICLINIKAKGSSQLA